jgi:hypothetical protein
MAELVDILDAFTTQLKVAWVVWLAWGVGQIFWYRYERRPKTATDRPARVRRPFVSKASAPQPLVTRLVTPEQVNLPPSPAVERQVVEPPGVHSFVDKAPALLPETDKVAELDRFIADFEMNTRHRRERPHNGENWVAR